MAEKTEKKSKPKAPAVPELFSMLPPGQLQRVATLPERCACPVRAGDRFALVIRLGDVLRFIEGKPEPERMRELFSKKKARGAVDVDVSTVRGLLN